MSEYGVFLIDSPWPYPKIRRAVGDGKRFEDWPYSVMSIKEIFQLLDKKIFIQGKDNHQVFMWATEKCYVPAANAMKKRGYRKHATFVWNKKSGIGRFSVRKVHEFMFWFYAGKMQWPECRGKYGTVFEGKKRDHSRKPDIVYKMLEEMYPMAKKLEVFARSHRKGWDSWGDEL